MKKMFGKAMSLGCIMIDIKGLILTNQEKKLLLNPLVAGVILFSRNFETIEQLQNLTTSIHDLRHPKLLIAVDHEGGRVQRFRTGFTEIPPMAWLGKMYDENQKMATQISQDIGWIIATELLSVGIDFSFTPVLDLDYGNNSVIGDRAFHRDFKVVSELSFFLMKGLHEAKMPAVGKHFPGHGYIQEDTHLTTAVDSRSLDEIKLKDLQPFLKSIQNNMEAIMPAHVIYPQIDSLAAGFSKIWLQNILRKKCNFMGAIISDDLSMNAAVEYAPPIERALKSLEAGCDLILFCNAPKVTEEVLNNLDYSPKPISHSRLIRLHGRSKYNYESITQIPLWKEKKHRLSKFIALFKEGNIDV